MFSISCMHFKFKEKQKLVCEHVSIQKKKKINIQIDHRNITMKLDSLYIK